MFRNYRGVGLTATGLGLALLSGCQTWSNEAGMTLPTGHYLTHTPQYFPPSPPYPLPKELKSQEDAAQQIEENPRPAGQ
jgi:hypothetical protein